MTTLREAAQQALEALEYRDGDGADQWKADVITALRAALAEPVQEPVAYRHMHDDGWEYYDAPTGEDCERCQALYTAPPQRKPLTEEEMYIVEEEARKNFRLAQAGPRGQMITYWDSLTPWLIRAVERAHGIKE